MTDEFKNILVVSLQGIGDILLTTPLLRGLKCGFPAARIYVLTFRSNKDVLSRNPYVDGVITFDARANRYIFTIPALLRNIRETHADLSICAYPSGLRSAVLAYLSGAGERLGQRLSLFKNYRWLFTNQVPITEVKHAVLMNLDFLKLLGIDSKKISTDLVFNIDDDDMKFSQNFLRLNKVDNGDLVVAIHAGGGRFTSAYRNWSLEKFARTADVLMERFKAKIIFIGGKNDEAAVNFIANIMAEKPIIAAGKMSLKQTAVLLKRAKFLLCNNSGPMHIAAALNVPTISIFGSADPRIHRPWGENHIVLQSRLECSPCYYPFFRDTLEETKQKNNWFGKKFKCRSGDYRCLTGVAVDQVVEAAEKLLKDS